MIIIRRRTTTWGVCIRIIYIGVMYIIITALNSGTDHSQGKWKMYVFLPLMFGSLHSHQEWCSCTYLNNLIVLTFLPVLTFWPVSFLENSECGAELFTMFQQTNILEFDYVDNTTDSPRAIISTSDTSKHQLYSEDHCSDPYHKIVSHIYRYEVW